MKPKGTVYESGKSGTHGELILLLPRVLKAIYHLLRTVGAGMIAFSFLVFMFSYGPIISQELSFRFGSTAKINEESKNDKEDFTFQKDYTVESAQANEILAVQNEASLHGLTSYFSIVIPKINAKSNVLANVDTNDKASYLDALSKGVAHAKGTYFPGQEGRVFIFSHSTDSPINFTRYNAIFYLLGKLEKGDEIIIYFADKKYVYEVSEKVVVDPTDISWIIPKSGEEELVLMTCDPPGTTWRRLLVVAKPV